MDIIFQSGDFFLQESFSILSFFTSLLGAIIGAGTALTIYVLTTRKEKRKEKDNKEKLQKNTLTYFSALVKTIILVAEKYNAAYVKIIADIREKPLTQHIIIKHIDTDIDRIVNKLDHEKIFQIYLEKFGNSKDRIDKFQKIYSRLDYFHGLFPHVTDMHANYLIELTNRMLQYKDLVEENTLNNCMLLLNFIHMNNPEFDKDPLYISLDTVWTNYNKNKPNPILIDYTQNSFVLPLRDELVSKHLHLQEAVLLLENCRKATWLYNETIVKSNQTADDFQKYQQLLADSISQLKELTNDIIK